MDGDSGKPGDRADYGRFSVEQGVVDFATWLSSCQGSWCRVQICGPTAALASGEAVLPSWADGWLAC